MTSHGLSLGGWAIEGLWLYSLGAALSILVGLQLIVFWASRACSTSSAGESSK